MQSAKCKMKGRGPVNSECGIRNAEFWPQIYGNIKIQLVTAE